MTPISSSLWFVVIGLVVAALGTLSLALYTVFSTDGESTSQAFAVLLTAVFVWTAGQGARLLTGSLANKLIWQGVLYVGIVATPVAWFLFTLVYTGRGRYVGRVTIAASLIVPVASLLSLYTNSLHGLYYSSVTLASVGGTPILQTEAGVLWWVTFGYSYLLVGLGILLLLRFVIRAERLYRVQTAALFLACLLPVGANIVFLFGLLADPVVDLTPLAFALSTLLLFVAVFYGRFLDVVPVAHDAVVRTLEDGILVVDEDGQILSSNPAAERMLSGTDAPRTLVGADLSDVEATLGFPQNDASSTTEPGLTRGFEAASRTDGETEWFWVRNVDLTAATTTSGSVLTLTDITEKKRFERQLRRLQQTHQRLLVAGSETEVVDIAVAAARDVLGLPITGIWKHDREASTLEPLDMTEQADDVVDVQPTFEPGESLAWEAFATGELRTYTDLRDNPESYNSKTPLRAEVIVPIGDWGVMSSGSTTETTFRDVDFDLLSVLAAAVESAVVRTDRERRIRELQRRTGSLIRAESTDEIAREAVDAADEVLGLGLTGIYLLTGNDDALEGVAVTPEGRKRAGFPLSYKPDEGGPADVVWDAFEEDDVLTVEDTDAVDTPLGARLGRSVIVHPLTGHGVFIASSSEPDAFGQADQALVELFATTVTAALDRVDRERKLRSRERELQRQNRRLEEFTSVVSHDLRSPLNTVALSLGMVTDEVSDDRLDAAKRANERAQEMVDDLLTLAPQGKIVEDPSSGPLAETVRRAWQSVPTSEATLSLDHEIGTVAADHSRLRQAFENLFRNSVEHGSTGSPSETDDVDERRSWGSDASRPDAVEHDEDPVRIVVGRMDEKAGIYVADDGPGILEDQRGEVFDYGYTTAGDGTGFGLAIVKRVVEAHGWQVRATESADSGARFEIFGMETLSGTSAREPSD